MDSGVLIWLGAALAAGVVLLIFMTWLRPNRRTLDKARYHADWQNIEMAVGDTNSSMQFAILQADKLLDKALKESGYKGKTMGERMASASRVFSKPDAVWSAHKLRNKIAHETDVRVNPKLTRRVLVCFKKALNDVGAM